MRDMNFFAPLQIKKTGLPKGSILMGLIIVIVIGVIAVPVGLFVQIYRVNMNIATIQSVLNQAENVKALQDFDAKRDQVTTLQTVLGELKLKNIMIQNGKWFSEELLQVIVDAMPKQIHLSKLASTDAAETDGAGNAVRGFLLEGIAIDKPAIAELEHTLRQSGRFQDIFVSTIEGTEGQLLFALQFNVKSEVGQ